MSELPVVRDPPPEADRARPAVLLAVAVVSMAVGFLVVWLPGRGGGRERIREEPHERTTPPRRGGAEPEAEPAKAPVLAVAPRPAEGVAVTAGVEEPAAPGNVAPTPGTGTGTGAPVISGGALRARAGDVYYWRCWDEGRDDPLPAEHCERLRAIEPQIADQLDTLAACARERGAGPGKLSLGIELNFPARNVRFWGGRSSTIANAADVAGCLRDRWRIDLDAVRHLHSRYTLFVPVDLEAR